MNRLVILGTGRGSAELYDLVYSKPHPATFPAGTKFVQVGQREVVFLDDKHPEPSTFEGCQVVGTLNRAQSLVGDGFKVLNGIANARSPGQRQAIAERLALPDEAWLVFCARNCSVSHKAKLEPGVVLYPGVCVSTHVTVGRHSIIYYNSVLHHDVVLGAGVVLCAGVQVAGNVTIEEGGYLGVGSTVKDGVRIGARAVVGAGAVVADDVAPGATVAGVPARRLESKP